jgi:hypothetical protein
MRGRFTPPMPLRPRALAVSLGLQVPFGTHSQRFYAYAGLVVRSEGEG